MKPTSLNADVADDLGKNIMILRQRKALTRRDLANKSCLHEDVLLKVERGKRLPTLATVIAIADALEVPLRDLFLAWNQQGTTNAV
jgi:transcriptional regulator with XRE-family HTH domain